MITVFRNEQNIERIICRVAADHARYVRALMGKNEVIVEVNTEQLLPVRVLDYIRHEGLRYTLNREPEFTKVSDVEYRYTLTFEAPQYTLLDKSYTYPITDQTRFYLTGTLRDFVELIIENINQIDAGWSVGLIPETVRKNILFESITCGDVLNKLANEFAVEYQVSGKRIDYYERYEQHTGQLFEQGQGKGLYTLTQRNVDTDNTITRAILYGGTRNIPIGYRNGSEYIRWADPVTGKYFVENFDEYKKVVERDVYFDDVYPHFDGTIDAVSGEYNEVIHCDAIDFNINDHLIGGLTAKINFVTGELTGEAFELTYDHDRKEVTLIRKEDETALPDEEGSRPLLPSVHRKAQVGDAFNFTDINMPEEYVRRAEELLHTKGLEWLNIHSQLRVLFDLEVDHRYLRKSGQSLQVGDIVRVRVPEAEIDRLLRIISVEQNLHDGSLTCEVSNYPRYSWEKDIEGRIEAAKERVEILKSEVLFDVNSTKEWVYRHFARLFGGNTFFGDQLIKGVVGINDARLVSGEHGIANRTLKLLDKDFLDNFVLELFRVYAREVMVKERISSEEFVSGFLGGTGWAMQRLERENAAGQTETKSALELDELTVRGALRVYEMIISQLIGENGTRLTTDMMRVAAIDPEQRTIYLDSEGGVRYNPFRTGDVLMVQQFAGMPQGTGYEAVRQYELVVTAAGVGTDGDDRRDWITYGRFVGEVADVHPRDVLVRVDSLTDADRRGVIKQTAVEPGSPYLDVLYGMKTDPADAVRVRLGRLAGIITHWWGQLQGYGLYSDNAYLLGDFRLRTGEDVLTRFEVIEGLLSSSMQGVMQGLTEADNFLRNATFRNNLEFWERASEIDLYQIGGEPINWGMNFISWKQKVADTVLHDGRWQLQIRNSGVRQLNVHIRKPEKILLPEIGEPAGGESEGKPNEIDPLLYLTFRYVCREAGILRVGFEGTDGPLRMQEQAVEAGSDYQTFSLEGIWDGDGDFVIECTGDLLIDELTLTSRPLEDYQLQVSTLFEQTKTYIEAQAERIDSVNQRIDTAGWITTADGNKLWASHAQLNGVGQEVNSLRSEFNVTAGQISSVVREVNNLKDGATLVSYINQTASSVTINASKIKLEGYVTVNRYIEFTLDGKIKANAGWIGDFIIQNGSITAQGSDGFSLSPFLIRYGSAGTGVDASFGESTLPMGQATCPLSLSVMASSTVGGSIGIYLDVKGRQDGTDTYYWGNNAMYIANGYVTGLRRRVRRITAGGTITLTELDSTIIIYSSAAVTINLPARPQEGQEYTIQKAGSGAVTINANGKEIISGSGTTTSVSISERRMVDLYHDSLNGRWAAAWKWNF